MAANFASSKQYRRSLFDEVFDAVVMGSGYAAYAAAIALRRRRYKVLLIGTRGDLLWESGRAFCPDLGSSDDPEWRSLVQAVAQRGGQAAGWIDGALAEVVGTDRLIASGARVLYFARPIAVERDGDAVASAIVATKSGLRRIISRQWIDATESGELVRLIQPTSIGREAQSSTAFLMLQHPDWSRVSGSESLPTTTWPTERILPINVQPEDPRWRRQILEALTELEATIGPEIAHVSMSHLSVEPVPRYAASAAFVTEASNVASASPMFSAATVNTLSDRYTLGINAGMVLDVGFVYEPSPRMASQPMPVVQPTHTVHADVCVAGAGTGGAVAALAAATAGAAVACIEPLAFVGGIGTGGGIHGYWFGAAGGLQQEVDRRTKEAMKRFLGGPFGDGPFNPWAKMITLEQMLLERGANLYTDAAVFEVDVDSSGEVHAVLAATPDGVLRVEARTFVDGTADGDLCARAGADFTHGRQYDGLLHAYSQSSGRLQESRGRPRMEVVNFDAGFCDPTNDEDLTRARLAGVRQYLADRYDNFGRPTYIAPALGLRQARNILTDDVLTLDDQIHRRRFDDPVSYTAGHYDSHASDIEFESDEVLFWIWGNRQSTLLVACEVSYRNLLPRGLSNVWIGSRCLGVSHDAQYTTRLQRDMQRIGEAAGFAAAEAAKRGETSRQLPYSEVRRWLDHTGALDRQPRGFNLDFGSYPFGGEPANGALEVSDGGVSAKAALAQLRRGEPGEAIWWLYKQETLVREDVIRLLTYDAQAPMVSWLAAGVVAMWSDPAAEPRLIHAIDSLEYGFGSGYEWKPRGHIRSSDLSPLGGGHAVPNWLCAVALLRCCGTEACLPAIGRLLDRPVHGINTLTTIAITIERLIQSSVLIGDENGVAIEAILHRLLSICAIGSVDRPERHVGRYSENAVRGCTDTPAVADFYAVPSFQRDQLRNTYQDNTWQLHLAVARARVALGLRPQHTALHFVDDARAPVRQAFIAISQSAGANAVAP